MSGPNFEVFTIDLLAIDRVVGSGDAKVLGAIIRDDDTQELRDAMTALIVRGARPFGADPFALSRVALRLCRVIGSRINGNTCDVLHRDALVAAAAIVQPLRLHVGLYDIVARGDVPVRGMPPSDAMRFSVIDAANVQIAYPRWAGAMPTHTSDDDADSLLAEMVDWLEVANARGESLVSAFWY